MAAEPAEFSEEPSTGLPELQLTVESVFNRTTIFYGPSNTGKTVGVKLVMKLLQPLVPEIVVVSPTEGANRSYEGFVPPTLIWASPSAPDPNAKRSNPNKDRLRFYENLWSRQEAKVAVYQRVNNLDTLVSLFRKLPSEAKAEGAKCLGRINEARVRALQKLEDEIPEVGVRLAKSKEVKEHFVKAMALVYRRFIVPHRQELWEKDLTTEERFSIENFGFNPALLLVLDDIAAEYKNLWKEEVFKKFFYQNRHSHLSVVVTLQDDTELSANLRKNAFVSIFTEAKCARANFSRKSNSYSVEEQNTALDAIKKVYRGHRKLAYLRDDPRRQHYYHITMPFPQPFRFGDEALWELNDRVLQRGEVVDKLNPYARRFG